MRTSTHILGVLAGLAATVAIEAWTTSAHGVRSAAHYAAVDRESMAPKAIALAFDRTAYQEGHPRQAAAQYLASDFAFHADGIRGADRAQWLSQASKASAVGSRTIEQVAADGDVVMVHYVVRAAGTDAGSGVDIFRIENHRIAELWSVRDGGPVGQRP